MPFFSLEVPPGVFRNGTERQSAGRFYDMNLARWYGKAAGPIRGWRTRGSAVTGKARAAFNWHDNSSGRWTGVGTEQKLYAVSAGPTNFDITPSDFVTGDADASSHTGFGYGTFGTGTFGTPRPDTGTLTPATVWDLDNFGQYLVGCAACDGRLLEWQLDTGTKAAAVTNAPTGCTGTFVTAERAHVGLGAGSNPRKVQWSDVGDNTTWSPSSTNKAGDVDLQTPGQILLGRRMPDQNIILTDQDAWSMSYIGDIEVYSFRRVGDGCGAISKGCCVVIAQQAIWWGDQGFWIYDGALRPLNCDVLNYVQDRLNTGQRSKITSFHNVKFGEVWWYYPSNSGTENDSYVFWDYRKNVWGIGSLVRLSAVEAGIFVYPIEYDADGQGYEHEVGSNYDGISPYARTGPFELGSGSAVMRAVALIQDEATEGLETVGFYTRLYPNGDETAITPTALDASGQTSVRFTARQVELLITFANDNTARWGAPRLELYASGKR